MLLPLDVSFCDGEEGEVRVVGEVVDYGAALLASGAGDEDRFGHVCGVILRLWFALVCYVYSNG
jgi:hypothetical protein